MLSCKTILIIFIFLSIFSINLSKTSAQTPKTNLSENTPHSLIKEGKIIITDVQFIGLDSEAKKTSLTETPLYESEARKFISGYRILIFNNARFDSKEIRKAFNALKLWLSTKGYLGADVKMLEEKNGGSQMKLIFSISRGEKALVSEIYFTGNKSLTEQELIENLKQCLKDDWQVFYRNEYSYYLQKCSRQLMFSKGFFQAKVSPMITRFDSGSFILTFPVEEGVRFRLGEVQVIGATVLSPGQIISMLGQKTGDVIDGKALLDFLREKLVKIYANKGYLQSLAAPDVEFIKPQAQGQDGVVNLIINIDEGRQFRLSRVKISGVEPAEAQKIRRTLDLKEGEFFNKGKLENGIKKINQQNKFKPIDIDRDVQIHADDEVNDLFLAISVHKN